MAPTTGASPRNRTLDDDIWRMVVDCLLDDLRDEYPTRPLLPDSYLEPIVAWQPGPQSSRPPACLPYNCCWTPRGARSGQAQSCFFQRLERQGLTAMLHANRQLRRVVLYHYGYLPLFRFKDPTFWNHHRDMFIQSGDIFIPTGACLCLARWASRHVRRARRIKLTLPSTDEQDLHSSARWLIDAFLEHGIGRLEDLDVRCDWAEAYEEDAAKIYFISAVIRRMRALNFPGAVVGPNLSDLELASEEDHYSWKLHDTCQMLRECTRLKRLTLLAIVSPDISTWNPDTESPIILQDLSFIHVRDSLVVWRALHGLLFAPQLARVHVDVIAERMMSNHDPDLAAFEIECGEIARLAVRLCPRAILSAEDLTYSLHFQRDLDEDVPYIAPMLVNWPEYLQAKLTRAHPFPDDAGLPVKDELEFILTQRSAMTSTKPLAPGERRLQSPRAHPFDVFTKFWIAALYALQTSSPMHRHVLSDRVIELVMSCDHRAPSPISWHELFVEMPNIRKLYVLGIRKDGGGLRHLASALGTYMQETFVPGEEIVEIRLPHWNSRRGPIPVDALEERYHNVREFHVHPIVWSQ
ncbi:unnamed protein product [Peniophora sp. CBMAI 1063]|nr:unnamed protein product [Peniophora sp. CBMAI 1063]